MTQFTLERVNCENQRTFVCLVTAEDVAQAKQYAEYLSIHYFGGIRGRQPGGHILWEGFVIGIELPNVEPPMHEDHCLCDDCVTPENMDERVARSLELHQKRQL